VNSKDRFAQFQKTVRRRRMMKKQMAEKMAQLTQTLVKDLSGETQNSEEYQMYCTIKDTFNAFDKDGNAELGFPEYLEAWKFLSQPGTDEDIKRAFDAVDVDASGLVEFDEFIFSIMGETALKYGPLADMEKLTGLLENVTTQFTSMNLNMNISVYGGLQNVKRLHRANLSILASQYQLEDMTENVALLVANSYLQILFSKESLSVQKFNIPCQIKVFLT
jgi:hypothetical protein